MNFTRIEVLVWTVPGSQCGVHYSAVILVSAEGLVCNRRADGEFYMTRETFLDVRTPGEALDFLSLTGPFRIEKDSLLWSDFQRWQELIRIFIQNGPLPSRRVIENGKDVGTEFSVPEHLRAIMGDLSLSERWWFMGRPEGIEIASEPDSAKPDARGKMFAQINVHSTLEAILATAYVDRLNGVNFGLCALPDCNNLFEIISNHTREYCSQACAHKASVRRRRAAAKAAKAKAKPRKANSSTRKGRN